MASPLTPVPFNTAAYSPPAPYNAMGASAAAGGQGYPSPYSAGQPAQPGLTNNRGLNIIINNPYVTGDEASLPGGAGGSSRPAPFMPGQQQFPAAQSFPMMAPGNAGGSGDAFGPAFNASPFNAIQGQGGYTPTPVNPALPPTDQLTMAYANANALSNQAVNALAAAEAARKSYLNMGQQFNTQAAPAFPPGASNPGLLSLPPAQQAPAPFQASFQAPGPTSPQPTPAPALQDPFAAATANQAFPGQQGGFQPPAAGLSATPTPMPMPMTPTFPQSPAPAAANPAAFPTDPSGVPAVAPAPEANPAMSGPGATPGAIPGVSQGLAPQDMTGLPPQAPLPATTPLAPDSTGMMPGAQAGMPPASAPNPAVPPTPGQSPLAGAPAQVLNELLLSSNPQNNEYGQLQQAAKKNKGQSLPDTLIRSARLQQQAEAIEEIAMQAQQPGRGPFPQETFDRLELLSNVDTKGLKGQSKEEVDTLRQESLWTLGLLNAAQNANTPTNSLPGLKTIERIIRDNAESPSLRRAAAQALQASLANRSTTKEAQEILNRIESNGKAPLKLWTALRPTLPPEVKAVVVKAKKGEQIAPPQQAPAPANMMAMPQGQGQLPGASSPSFAPPMMAGNGLPGPTEGMPMMDPALAMMPTAAGN